MISGFFHISARNLFVVFLFIAQWHILFVRLDNDRIKNVIGSDGTGYYDYLAKTFIRKDYPFALPGIGNQDKPPVNPDELRSITGGPVNKYFFGESLALLPFFLAADWLTQALRPDMRDGLSSYYQIAVSLAALAYLFLGLWMMHRILKRMNYAQEIINLMLILLFLGTNLYYYALQEPSMSHVYSFAGVALFLDQLHLQLEYKTAWRWLFLSLLVSWIVFIRPVNGLIVLTVFPLAGSFQRIGVMLLDLIRRPFILLICLLIPFVFVGIQGAFYYLQAGKWWVDSYGNEGFNFLQPEIVNVLFSFRKGLFIYTPLLLLIVPGIWFYRMREGVFSAISWILTSGIYFWVIASWWYWAYGGSYGMRPVIDFFPFLVLPIAALAEVAYRKYFNFRVLWLIVLLGVFLNLLQVWQYVQSILPYEGMNRARYSHIFLETQRHFRFIYPAEPSDLPFSEYSNQPVFSYSRFSDADSTLRIGDEVGNKKIADLFSSSFRALFTDTIPPRVWLEIQGEFRIEDAATDASFITCIKQVDCWYWNRYFIIQSLDTKNEWRRLNIRIDLPDVKNPDDILTVSLMNERKLPVEARDIKIRLLRK